MADTKISALTDGAPAQGTEDVPVALSGSNYRLTTGDIALLALQDAFQGAITVNAATTAALAGAPTYANGAAGVGATLTKGSNGAFPTQDGIASVAGNTYLVKNQATQTQNGVYELTTLGTGGTPWVLTRTTDSDQPSELNAQIVIVGAGTVNKRRLYSQTTATPTIGTNNIIYAQTPAPNMSEYVRRNGTVDFIGAETWDFGGTDTTVISDTAIAISDGTLQGLLQKDLLQISDALGGQAQVTELAVAVASAAGDSTGITSDGLTILRSAGGTMEKKFIKVSLTAGQIQGANSSPVEVIPAGAAGTVNVPVNILYVFTANTTPFTSTSFHLDTTGAANGDGLFYSYQAVLSTGADLSESMAQNDVVGQIRTCATATAIVFMADSDSAVGDGTIDLYIEYNIITL